MCSVLYGHAQFVYKALLDENLNTNPLHAWRPIEDTLANNVDLDQTSQNVESDQGLTVSFEYRYFYLIW